MRVTLQDIAMRLGVTPSTVQRALKGYAGVSAKRRDEIIRVAEEMNYRPNFHASSLKRGTMRIAVVLSDPSYKSNRYFAYYLWQGIDQYTAEVSGPDIEWIRLAYRYTPQDQGEALESILSGRHGRIDGIITGFGNGGMEDTFDRISQAGIPVVLIGTDIPSGKRLCCVMNYKSMKGYMAADLLTIFGRPQAPGKVIVCADFRGGDQAANVQSLEQSIWERNQPLSIYKIPHDADPDRAREAILRELTGDSSVYAIYACSTRSTIAMCQAVEAAGLAGKVHTIGSDLFQKSAEYMRKGVLQAIMHSRPMLLSYQAAQVMTEYLAMGQKPADEHVFVEPCVILPGSLEYYIDSIPNFDKENEAGPTMDS